MNAVRYFVKNTIMKIKIMIKHPHMKKETRYTNRQTLVSLLTHIPKVTTADAVETLVTTNITNS